MSGLRHGDGNLDADRLQNQGDASGDLRALENRGCIYPDRHVCPHVSFHRSVPCLYPYLGLPDVLCHDVRRHDPCLRVLRGGDAHHDNHGL